MTITSEHNAQISLASAEDAFIGHDFVLICAYVLYWALARCLFDEGIHKVISLCVK